MRLRAGSGRHRLVALATGALWLLAAAASGGLPRTPPDAGQLLATLLTVLFAVALCATLGLEAGAELALGGAGRGEGVVRGFLQAAAGVPSVAVGAALLIAWSDVLHLPGGIWLAALGLGLLNLPAVVLQVAQGFHGHGEIAHAALALGANAAQAARAVFPAVRREVGQALLQAAGRSLGEAALVALLAGSLAAHGEGALRAGATLAGTLWYLEMQGRIGTSEAFWPVTLLLALAALAAGISEFFFEPRQEGLTR
jgi:ABC-type phosphate transport system permease subunit